SCGESKIAAWPDLSHGSSYPDPARSLISVARPGFPGAPFRLSTGDAPRSDLTRGVLRRQVWSFVRAVRELCCSAEVGIGGADGQARDARHGQRSPRGRATEPVGRLPRSKVPWPDHNGAGHPGADARAGGWQGPPAVCRPAGATARLVAAPAAPGWERVRRGTPTKDVLEAMDVEGIDVGILFRTWATHAINIDGLEPALAAAMSRAWNRWITDFCTESPERLKPSGLVPLQDIDLAVAEARFAVRDLGAITLVLPSHLINGRPIYDRYYDPLWATAQEM